MKISYDPEIDALYIRLIEGKYECRTLRLNEEIALNIGSDEKLVGIEILIIVILSFKCKETEKIWNQERSLTLKLLITIKKGV
ncbi:MAG TPA: DUF2283 domain-containing protein [Candidatus Brocadiaceae bacterium]|nr:DUF2283 domain-containing protein [Candidatus Brocadiaceae bacterium]